jgi:alcohol dehydrogenase class IV
VALESVLAVSSAALKYGPGATREVGFDLKELGARRVLVVTDPQLASSEPVAVTLQSLRSHGLDAVLYAEARVEPTDGSLLEAVRAASGGGFDGYVGVGGGSSMDTAKAASNTHLARGLPGLRERAYRARAAGARAPAPHGRHPDHRRHRQRDHRGDHFRL